MSCRLTRDQVLARTKTETRRVGWLFAKPGMHLRLVDRVMGFRKGQHPKELAVVRVLEVRREPLDAIDQAGCDREGFPHYRPHEFVAMFLRHMRVELPLEVTVIRWAYDLRQQILPPSLVAAR